MDYLDEYATEYEGKINIAAIDCSENDCYKWDVYEFPKYYFYT